MELDTVKRTLELMRTTFGDTFKEYYDGDPEQIPLFNLPAIIVDQTGDATTEGAYEQDDVDDSITIKVVLDKRDDFNGNKVDPLNLTARKIRELVGKRDPVTKKYEVQTVKGALRNHLVDDITALAPTVTVEYGIVPRSGGAEYATLTAEGHVKFSMQYTINTD
jgi:hypothetical protein